MDRSVPEGPWRFFSIILALLAASGPVTALINGIFDRELEKAKFENDQNLQYVELILAEYHNEDERRSAYQFMDIALNASNPSRVIKDHVQQKLADYDKRDRLTADLWAAKSALAETERQNIKLANTINELTARLSGATAHDTMELTSQVDELSKQLAIARNEREAALTNLRQIQTELDIFIKGASIRPPAAPYQPTAMEKRLLSLCESVYGHGSLLYRSPEDFYVSCDSKDGSAVFTPESQMTTIGWPRHQWPPPPMGTTDGYSLDLIQGVLYDDCTRRKGTISIAWPAMPFLFPPSAACTLESGRADVLVLRY